MVVRVLAGLLPFARRRGLVYWALLRRHDINYYLSQRPPEFWVAAVARRGDRRRAGGPARADDRPLGARAAARPVRGRPAPAGPRRERPAVEREPPCRSLAVLASWAAVALWSSLAVATLASRSSSAAAWRRTSPARWRCSCCSSRGWLSCGPPLGLVARHRQRLAVRAGDRPALPARRRPAGAAGARAGEPGTLRRARPALPPGRGRRGGHRRARVPSASRCSRWLVTRRNQPVARDRPPRRLGGRAREHAGGLPAGGRAGRRLRRARRPGVGRRRGPGRPRQRPHEGRRHPR